jgi:hypothetical protein
MGRVIFMGYPRLGLIDRVHSGRNQQGNVVRILFSTSVIDLQFIMLPGILLLFPTWQKAP